MKADFSALTPVERNQILVASDSVYEELIKKVDWGKVAIDLGGHIWGPIPWWIIKTGLGKGSKWGMQKSPVSGLIAPWQRGEIPILHLCPKEAVARFRFEPGAPIDGCLYVRHPLRDDYYLVPQGANETLIAEKYAALCEIAGALGARELWVTGGQLTTKQGKGKGNVDATLGDAAGKIGFNVQVGATKVVERSICNRWGEPKTSISVPEVHQVWIDEDPGLRQMVTNRLNTELERTEVRMAFDNQWTVNSNLFASVPDLKARIGGDLREVVESRWSFEVVFWPKTKS